MGFEVRSEDGKTVPVVVCDGCGQDINDGLANVLYGGKPEPSKPTNVVRVLHKRCPDGKQRDEPDKLWEDLDHYLLLLLANAGYNLKESVKQLRESPWVYWRKR